MTLTVLTTACLLALVVAVLHRTTRRVVSLAICYVQQAYISVLRGPENGPLSEECQRAAIDHAIDAAQILLGAIRVTMLRVLLLRWNLRPWLAIHIEAVLHQLKHDELITPSNTGWKARNPALSVTLDTATQWLTRYMQTMRSSTPAAPRSVAAESPTPGSVDRSWPCGGSH